MKAQICGLKVAGAVFGLAALVQVARLVIQPAVVVNGYVVPLWPSVVAVVILGGLCAWMFRLAQWR